MELSVKTGKYVAAVSGGVDSVVLLDLLRRQSDLDLVVAHFDHGIRPDSAEDRKLVADLARQYGLEFFYEEGRLGSKANEALAREKRYAFLSKVKNRVGAEAIITAHHQDDLLETAILNLLRGTGRKGLSSLRSTAEVRRPLLGFPKSEIIEYAKEHKLQWREDSTNADEKYLRNYVRRRLLPRFDAKSRRQLLSLINAARLNNEKLDELLASQLQFQPSENELDRRWFAALPHDVAREIMAVWLRRHGVIDFDKKTIERLVTLGKTLSVGKQADVGASYIVKVRPEVLALARRDR